MYVFHCEPCILIHGPPEACILASQKNSFMMNCVAWPVLALKASAAFGVWRGSASVASHLGSSRIRGQSQFSRPRPPPENNELALSMNTGCADTVDLFDQNQTPRSDSADLEPAEPILGPPNSEIPASHARKKSVESLVELLGC